MTKSDPTDVSLGDFAGKKKLLNIVPSPDAGVCAAQTRRFHQAAAGLKNAVVLIVSNDLPFAQKRFCDSEGIENVVTLSELRERKFGEDYGMRILDGPLAGLLSRAVVVLDENDRVLYKEQVPEIAKEPDYEKALAAIKKGCFQAQAVV